MNQEAGIFYDVKTLAQTTQQTKAKPEAIFNLWADVNNWADYDEGIEWAKLTDSFGAGGHYTIKPKGGPKVKATIFVVEPTKRFVDESHSPTSKGPPET
ncbi:MAG: SRPBCC family protein [Acidithiobacillus ferrivorans]